MATAVYTDARCLAHDTGQGHPERAARLPAIWGALGEAGLWDYLRQPAAQPLALDEMIPVHDPDYLLALRTFCEQGGGLFATDAPTSADSWRAATWTAGAACSAARAVLAGELDRALVLGRPPGHHAGRAQARGFCLVHNAALAARAAQAAGAGRVFILDWDVHHGNGTQEIFYEDASVFACSLHQSNWYPFTGLATERGRGAGYGTTLNLPLPRGTGPAEMLEVLAAEVAPALAGYQPDLVLVSCGTDGHVDDPLGGWRLTARTYGAMMRQVLEWAAEVCEGRVVVLLEGGYELDSLAASMVEITQALVGLECATISAEDGA